MSTQFLIDDKGNKIAAVIPISEYVELMEDLEDLTLVAERRSEERVSFDEVKKQLISDSLLPS